jgi:hypothetical protein
MAVRLGNVLWWMGLSFGGVVWTALLALAHSAGPIDEAVFWATLKSLRCQSASDTYAAPSYRARSWPQPIPSLIRRHYRRLKMQPLKLGQGQEKSRKLPKLPSDEVLSEKTTLR